MLIFRKLTSRECYKPRHVTKRDVLATIQQLFLQNAKLYKSRMTKNCAIIYVKWRPCKPTVPSSLVIMFTGYPWYPRGKVVKVGVCVTKLRHLEQILLPNVNDHATKLTLFDKDFHVPRLPILTRKKKVNPFFPFFVFTKHWN